MSSSKIAFIKAKDAMSQIQSEMAKGLVGKTELVNGILAAAMCRGHILLEGVPGLAKTLAVRLFADATGLVFKRIQFTPDLLPGDITGTLFFESSSGRFIPREGPIFANIVLADEINRAPAKVQSALLEAMEERQVSMGDRSLKLPDPFMVLATQNPLEHEGTFRLPEAQLDRFMLKLLVDYPDEAEELAIVLGNTGRKIWGQTSKSSEAVNLSFLPEGLAEIKFDERLAEYAIAIVRASRPGQNTNSPKIHEIDRFLEFGASPRASIALHQASRASALLNGRDYVLPDDIKQMAYPVLRHRILVSYEAEAERISPDSIIRIILENIRLP